MTSSMTGSERFPVRRGRRRPDPADRGLCQRRDFNQDSNDTLDGGAGVDTLSFIGAGTILFGVDKGWSFRCRGRHGDSAPLPEPTPSPASSISSAAMLGHHAGLRRGRDAGRRLGLRHHCRRWRRARRPPRRRRRGHLRLRRDRRDFAGAAIDTIVDLSAEDVIDLSAIDANTHKAGDQAFALVGAFSHHAGELTLTKDGKFTTLAADVNGDGVADLTVSIKGDHHDFSNFVL